MGINIRGTKASWSGSGFMNFLGRLDTLKDELCLSQSEKEVITHLVQVGSVEDQTLVDAFVSVVDKLSLFIEGQKRAFIWWYDLQQLNLISKEIVAGNISQIILE